LNSLEKTLIEKVGYDTGWENVVAQETDKIVLSSARHRHHASIRPGLHEGSYLISIQPRIPPEELVRDSAASVKEDGSVEAFSRDVLFAVLQRAAELAMAMPDTPLQTYLSAVEKELIEHPSIVGTEAEATIRRRIGQDIYREALMQYWKGCCAVTACDVPQLLRASHAKPWKDANDEERLDVYNGFLLRADLDALFDTGLITFSDEGELVISPKLSEYQVRGLGLDTPLHLIWIEPAHRRYLAWHRERVFQGNDT